MDPSHNHLFFEPIQRPRGRDIALVILLIILLMGSFIGLTGFGRTETGKIDPVKVLPTGMAYQMVDVYMGKNHFVMEKAMTAEAQEQGLMFRSKVEPLGGMVFGFHPSQHVAFWMKNCLMPLDLVFVRNHRVVRIEHSAPPCKADPCPIIRSKIPVDTVIEVLGGQAKSLNMAVGDRVTFRPQAGEFRPLFPKGQHD